MTNQTPQRIDIIRDKLIGIEMRAYQARHVPQEQEQELMRLIRIISSLYNELWTILNTDEEKGKQWGWWG